VQALDQLLDKMEGNSLKYNVTSGEVNRRRGLVADLKQKAIAIEDSLSGQTSRTKQQLFAATGKGRDGDGGVVEEDPATRDLTPRDLVQATEQQLKDQDQSLANIERGVVSLKDLGNGMSTQLDLQKSLLNDLEKGIDKTQQAFQNNTQRIQIVEEEDGSKAMGCGIIMCMLLLLVLIVFLASSNYPCHIFNSRRC